MLILLEVWTQGREYQHQAHNGLAKASTLSFRQRTAKRAISSKQPKIQRKQSTSIHIPVILRMGTTTLPKLGVSQLWMSTLLLLRKVPRAWYGNEPQPQKIAEGALSGNPMVICAGISHTFGESQPQHCGSQAPPGSAKGSHPQQRADDPCNVANELPRKSGQNMS